MGSILAAAVSVVATTDAAAENVCLNDELPSKSGIPDAQHTVVKTGLRQSVSNRDVIQTDREAVLQDFLMQFDQVESLGFVQTLRPGSTGVGYTLESLLGMRENNNPGGDFRGMEVKAYRDSELQFDDREKMNLFLKEPEWVDGLSSAERVRAYGYKDNNGRQAWYQSVTCQMNSSGLQLVVERKTKQVMLLRLGQQVARWQFSVLEQRLREKHSHTVFVAAEVRGKGANEEFHYRTVTWMSEPSIDQLLLLIESGDVILELRMHLRETGGVRNHGTAFRLKKHQLKKLFRTQRLCRPLRPESNVP